MVGLSDDTRHGCSTCLQFIDGMAPERRRTWASTEYEFEFEWDDDKPPTGTALRLVEKGRKTYDCGPDFRRPGRRKEPPNPDSVGLALASVGWLGNTEEVRYVGPGDIFRR